MLLIPGHKAELYCISAEEARELCIPIITLGIGCLKERVIHGKTGFIAKNEKELTDEVIKQYNEQEQLHLEREETCRIRVKAE